MWRSASSQLVAAARPMKRGRSALVVYHRKTTSSTRRAVGSHGSCVSNEDRSATSWIQVTLPSRQRNTRWMSASSKDNDGTTSDATTLLAAKKQYKDDTKAWNFGYTEYTDAAAGGDGDRAEEDDDYHDSQKTSTGRNKRLLRIARAGFVHLDRAAVYIQSNPQASKDLKAISEEQQGPDKAQLMEERRIFSTTQACLEAFCVKDPSFPLMAGDEPILIVGCRVNPALTFADVYWCLPESVLTAPDLHPRQLQYIQDEMRERIAGDAGRRVAHCVATKLAFYFAPKVRFHEAPPELVDRIVHEYEEDI